MHQQKLESLKVRKGGLPPLNKLTALTQKRHLSGLINLCSQDEVTFC
jgi:hypothetical protein